MTKQTKQVELAEWEHDFEDLAIDWNGSHEEKYIVKQFISKHIKKAQQEAVERERERILKIIALHRRQSEGGWEPDVVDYQKLIKDLKAIQKEQE